MKRFIIVSLIILAFTFIITLGITQVFKHDEPSEFYDENPPVIESDKENNSDYKSKLETLKINERGIINISGYVKRTDNKKVPIKVKVYVGHQFYYLDLDNSNNFSELITTSEEGAVLVSVWVYNTETEELEYLIGYNEQFVILESNELNYNQKIFIIVLIFGAILIVTSGIIIVLNVKEDKEDAKKADNKTILNQ